MKKIIDYSKLSKKEKRAVDLKKRNTWDRHPATQVFESNRGYNRAKVNSIYRNSE